MIGKPLSLDKMIGSSPLAKLLNGHLASAQLKRLRFYSNVFSQFHLKNMEASEVAGRMITLNGKRVINFGNGNYLGFDRHPEVLAAATHAIETLGHHAGSARIFYTHENFARLETEISELVGAEQSLVCVNVAQTHQGAIPSLFGFEGCTIFVDCYGHTSMYTASLIAKAKGAKVVSVDTRDPEALRETILKERQSGGGALLIDGVYSMQGELPDVPGLQAICREMGIVLYVDDAHGIGILGEHGGGVREHFDLSYDNLILVGSLQKGLAAFGGFIAGNRALIEYLRVTSTTYIFSGPLQPQAVEGARAAIRICRSEEGKALRQILLKKAMLVRRELLNMGFLVPQDETPIVPVPIGSDVDTLMAGRKAFDEGVYVNSVLNPAVPRGKGILRITVNSVHEDAEIEKLLKAFAALKEDRRIHRGFVRKTIRNIREVTRAKIRGDSYSGL